VASEHAEGGMYIGPEFQLGQVYDGSVENGDSVVLYRPVYLTTSPQHGENSLLRFVHLIECFTWHFACFLVRKSNIN
jgi:hypothetical protein